MRNRAISGWKIAFVFLLVASATPRITADVFDQWSGISSEESAIPTSPIYRDAPAVIVFSHIDVDDRRYPEQRVIRRYIRYKVVDPEKARRVITAFDLLNTGSTFWPTNFTLKGRIIQPDGSSINFGPEVMKEVQRDTSASTNWWESFTSEKTTNIVDQILTIPALVKGSTLDFRIRLNVRYPSQTYAYTLQADQMPTQLVDFVHRLSDTGQWNTAPTLVNLATHHATVETNKEMTISTITGRDLDPIYDEPYSVPLLERALAVLGDFEPRRGEMNTIHTVKVLKLDPNRNPWATYATVEGIAESDFVQDLKPFSALAKSLTAGATTEVEKARRIHAYAHAHYLEYSRSGIAKRTELPEHLNALPDQVISLEKHTDLLIPPSDFTYLAAALYMAAGLQVQELMLEDNTWSLINQRVASSVYLRGIALRVFADGAWHYSMPQTELPIPFDTLPYWNSGGNALVAQQGPATFIPIPFPSPAHSQTQLSGSFTLDETGTLSGSGKAVLTGFSALEFKSELHGLSLQKQKDWVSQRFTQEFSATKVSVNGVNGVEDLDSPVDVSFTLEIEDYAAVSKQRLIFRPSVFNGRAPLLFISESRHNAVALPFPYVSSEDVDISFPEGMRLEGASIPPSLNAGVATVDYACAYKPRANSLHYRRAYASSIVYCTANKYPSLRHWLETVARNDGAELVLLKAQPAAPTVPLP